MCSGRIGSFCSTSGTRRVNLVTNPVISHEWGKKGPGSIYDKCQVLQCSLHCVIKSRLHISARYKEIWLYYVCTNTTSLANIWQSKMFSNPKRFPTKTITVQKKTKIQGWITRNPTKAECETDQTKQNTQFQFKLGFFYVFCTTG